jgi:guanine deaminase
MNPIFLKQAIEVAIASVSRGGGPFGALVAKGGRVVATGANQVTSTNDPTAHAEVVVIREACKVLGSFQLSGCDLYSSCEPCPMCLGAIYWARPSRVFFAATHEQASRAGFDDSFIYRQIELPTESRSIPMFRVEDPDANAPFAAWIAKTDRTDY